METQNEPIADIKLSEIRKELEFLMPTGKITNTRWLHWKQNCVRPAIPDNVWYCTKEQWIQLAACVAMSRTGRRIGWASVQAFIRDNGNEPSNFLPGLLRIPNIRELPPETTGKRLRFEVGRWTGRTISEDSLMLWIKEWNETLEPEDKPSWAQGITVKKFSRKEKYSQTEIQILIWMNCRKIRGKVNNGLSQAKFNFPNLKVA